MTTRTLSVPITSVVAAAITACSGQSSVPPADLVLKNGRVVTLDDATPEAQAIVSSGGRIVFVGSNDAAAKYIHEGHRSQRPAESILGTPSGAPTTGLLQATQYLKDNRLLPRGFDKRTAAPEIAVFGAAATDGDFTGDGDRVRYRIPMTEPGTIEIELLYQPIGYRWAQNLAGFDAPEPRRFVGYYNDLAPFASVVVARTSRTLGP